jgi:hypothetical protein
VRSWNVCTVIQFSCTACEERQSDGNVSIGVKRHPLMRDILYSTVTDCNSYI